MEHADSRCEGIGPSDCANRGMEILDLKQDNLKLNEENLKLKWQLKQTLARAALNEDRAIYEMEQKEREAGQKEHEKLEKESAIKREQETTSLYDRVVEAHTQTVRRKNLDQLTMADLQEQLRKSQRDLHRSRRNQYRLQEVVLSQHELVQAQHEYQQLNQSHKRSTSSTFKSRRPGKRVRNSRAMTSVPCVKCYVNGLECDDGEPCCECVFSNKSKECKRVKCKNFSKGACKNSACPFAHEENGYKHLTAHIKLRRTSRDDEPDSGEKGINKGDNIGVDNNIGGDDDIGADNSGDNSDGNGNGVDHDTGGVTLAVAV